MTAELNRVRKRLRMLPNPGVEAWADRYAVDVPALLAERQQVIDIVNLYGDETLHRAFDYAGLLLSDDQLKPE